MVLRYPNGQPYYKNASPVEKIQEKRNQITEFGNRGMHFEEAINESNKYYLSRGLAVIHKKPTPIQIVKVDYPKRSAAVIKEAYFTQASTTDYNGVYRGFYLDFEAKETKNKTSFPFKNFHAHQGRKSLPLSLIEELGIEIKTGISPRIPYLDAVDFYLSTLSIEGESKNGK